MVSVGFSQDPLEASTKRGVMHLLCCNLRFCHAFHFTFNQSQPNGFSPRQIEVVRALDYRLKFKEASGSAEAAINQGTTFYSQMSQQFRLADVPFPLISLKLASGFLSLESAELQFHPMMLLLLKVPLFTLILARRQATKARREGGNDERGENGPGARGVSSSGVAAPQGTSLSSESDIKSL